MKSSAPRAMAALALVLPLTYVSSAAAQGSVIVYVVASEDGLAPIAQLPQDRDTELPAEQSDDGWRFALGSTDAVDVPLLVRLDGMSTDYAFGALELHVPFNRLGEVTTVYLEPYKPEAGSGEVRRLFATNVAETPEEELPRLYQRAHAIASDRMKNLRGQWDRLHDYDVQAVFKYLEVVRDLGVRGDTYIAPADHWRDALTWMNDAIQQRPDRVKAAIPRGIGDATLLVSQVAGTEGEHFGRLWRAIVVEEGTGPDTKPVWIESYLRQADLLLSYDDRIQQLPTLERRQRVARVTRVERGTVLTTAAQALVKHLTTTGVGTRRIPDEIRTRLEEVRERLRAAAPDAKDEVTKTNVNRRLEELDELLGSQSGDGS